MCIYILYYDIYIYIYIHKPDIHDISHFIAIRFPWNQLRTQLATCRPADRQAVEGHSGDISVLCSGGRGIPRSRGVPWVPGYLQVHWEIWVEMNWKNHEKSWIPPVWCVFHAFLQALVHVQPRLGVDKCHLHHVDVKGWGLQIAFFRQPIPCAMASI